MSKDSSSSNSPAVITPPKTGEQRSIPRAIVTTLAVVVAFLAAQFAGVVFLVTVLGAAGLSIDEIEDLFTDNAWVQFLAILIIELITVGLVFGYFIAAKRKPLQYLKLDKKPTLGLFGYVALAYVAYFITFVILAVAADALIPAVDTEQSQQIGFENTKGLDYLAVFAALAILPPIVEEIVFRGVLFQKLKQYLAIVPAVIITSVIFGVAHLEFFGDNPLNWIAAIDTVVFSLFLIALYVRTKSLWAPIALHALKNSIAFVFLFLI